MHIRIGTGLALVITLHPGLAGLRSPEPCLHTGWADARAGLKNGTLSSRQRIRSRRTCFHSSHMKGRWSCRQSDSRACAPARVRVCVCLCACVCVRLSMRVRACFHV